MGSTGHRIEQKLIIKGYRRRGPGMLAAPTQQTLTQAPPSRSPGLISYFCVNAWLSLSLFQVTVEIHCFVFDSVDPGRSRK